MAIDVRVLGRNDSEVLLHVAEEVFDNPVNPEFTKEFLQDPRHHLAVAIDAGIVVGFVSGVHYIHPDKAPQLWINEVSVAPTHRNQGLARTMMHQMFEVGRQHRCTEAWVLTDRLNEAAMALYTSVGGREGADDHSPSDAVLGYTFDLMA